MSGRKNALSSPTEGAKQRLGNRARSPSSDSGSVYSRRSVSMVRSDEDAEIFGQLSGSTSVSIKSSSNKKQAETVSANVSVCTSEAMDGFVDDAVALIGSCSPLSVGEQPVEQQQQQLKQDLDLQPKQDLDLCSNDNSFHVLASLLVDFFQGKCQGRTLTLEPEDRLIVERLLPNVQAFCIAVRFRLMVTPAVAVTPIQFLTLQCQELCLDSELDEQNPILAALCLKDEPVTLQVLTVLSEDNYLRKAVSSQLEKLDEEQEDEEEEAPKEDYLESTRSNESSEDGDGSFVVEMKMSSESSHESVIKVASSKDIADAMIAECEDLLSEDDSMPPNGGELEVTDIEEEEAEEEEEMEEQPAETEDEDDSIPPDADLEAAGIEDAEDEAEVEVQPAETEDASDEEEESEPQIEPAESQGEDTESMDPHAAQLGETEDVDRANESFDNQLEVQPTATEEELEIQPTQTEEGEENGENELESQPTETAEDIDEEVKGTEDTGMLERQIEALDQSYVETENYRPPSRSILMPLLSLTESQQSGTGTEEDKAEKKLVSEIESHLQAGTVGSEYDAKAKLLMTETEALVNSGTFSPEPDTLAGAIMSIENFSPKSMESEATFESGNNDTAESPESLLSASDDPDEKTHPEPFLSQSMSQESSIREHDPNETAVQASGSLDPGTIQCGDPGTMQCGGVTEEAEKAKAVAGDIKDRMQSAAGSFFADLRKTVDSKVADLQETLQDLKKEKEESSKEADDARAPSPVEAPNSAQPVDQEPVNPFLTSDDRAASTENQQAEHGDVSSPSFDDLKYANVECPGDAAKQQLLAELKEARSLAKQSVTPETKSFWQQQVVTLMARLDALSVEKVVESGLPPSYEEVQTFQQREMLPAVLAQADPEEPPTVSEAPSTPQQREMELTALSHSRSQISAPHMDPEQPGYDAPMVDVVAPADLPGGYHFEAEIEGQRFLATVPPGGVQQGETFTCYMRELDSVAIDIPVGYWKDGWWNLCGLEWCCHPVAWHSIFCPLIALGQIQTRINLDFLGRPKFGDLPVSNRFMMLIVVAFWTSTNVGLFAAFNLKWSRGMELSLADVIALALINVAMFAFVVFVTQSTRSNLRDKFMIREERCFDLEDICCAALCNPCTVGQMARHTANYDDYEAVCCSKTGLPDGVRVNQEPAKESDGYVV